MARRKDKDYSKEAPWLIGREALEHLDKYFDDALARLEEQAALLIDDTIAKSRYTTDSERADEVRRRFRPTRSLKIYSDKEGEFVFESFAEAFENVDMSRLLACGFEYSIESQYSTVKIELDDGRARATSLLLGDEAPQNEVLKKLNDRLIIWCSANEPPSWQTILKATASTCGALPPWCSCWGECSVVLSSHRVEKQKMQSAF